MSEYRADYIIVGSGPSGVQAAQTLVEAGCDVLMLDAGISSGEETSPNSSFLHHRQNDPEQYLYWLGKELRGPAMAGIRTGSQIAPSRKHIDYLTDLLTPFESESFFPMESLATGGLGIAWGLGCCRFSSAELQKAGLPIKEMESAYQLIADRIGISSSPDDATPYTMEGINTDQPAISIDANSQQLLKIYENKRPGLNKQGFYLGKASLALLTKEKNKRRPTPYNEMDFYTNDEAAYRPNITLQHLQRFPNFRYVPGVLVTNFEEIDAAVKIHFIPIGKEQSTFATGKKLLLAANITGTARIVLNSIGKKESRLPFLCNHYSYAPCLLWKRLGKTNDDPSTATAQLFLFHDRDGSNSDVAMASLYSYRSLMMFRLMQMVPVGTPDARILLQYLLPAMTIAGIHQPDDGAGSKFMWMEKNDAGKNMLNASAEFEKETLRGFLQREKQFLKTLKIIGCRPLKKINPGYGASLHYGGTLPFSENEKELQLLPDGRLGFTQNIYVVDGSGFNFLPAKGITFSLMANAHRVAANLARK